jgi:predicted ATP-grasp superfamily ATP-dependent carboligase
VRQTVTVDHTHQPARSVTAGDVRGIRVLVTDAETTLGLYVIRALGRAGCKVTALAGHEGKTVIGFSSRFAHRKERLPAGDYWQALPDAIEALAPTHDVLIPITAFSITVVASSAERLSPLIRFYLPSLEAFKLASDKRSTTKAAIEAGVLVPETYSGLDPATIHEWAEDMKHRLPMVVKFSDEERATAWAPADRYRIVHSKDELVCEYRRMHDIAAFPLVQDYVDGQGYGFFAIFDRSGEAAATFCHRRLREYPISGGPSTLCESVHDPKLIEAGMRMLKSLDWRGVAMVEFKRDRRTGEYRLLEINPRFWGSLPLAIQCGVNFPLYQVELALGLKPSSPTEYPVGRKSRLFFTDVLAVRALWRSGNRWQVAWQYARELLDISIRDGFIDLRDPRPLFTYLREKFGR